MLKFDTLNYDIDTFRGDFVGGLVAGIVALPLALAFGVQSGLGATAGLYGAIAVGILAAMFGGTAQQASGPTGPMTVITAGLVIAATTLVGSLEEAMPIIILTFILAGLFQILFGFLNIAKYVRFLPYPVISGFMSGIGLIIVILQIFPFFGMDSPKSTFDVIVALPSLFSGANIFALILGSMTIAIYYLFPRVTKKVPSTLVALVAVTAFSFIIGWNVPLIGDIPSGLPAIQIAGIFSIDASAYLLILEFALILAVLGSIDSLLTSVIADNITKTKHNSNRELIGQGIGNFVAGLFGGIPGAGATKGTVVNINAGGKTKLSGTMHGLFLLGVLLGLGQLARYIPLAVLAGILIPIGFAIVDKKGLKHLQHVPKADAIVLVTVLLITTFGSLINAVAIGIILSSVLFMKRSSDIAENGTSVTALARESEIWEDEIGILPNLEQNIYVKHLYGPMFFGFTSHFQELVRNLDKDLDILIIRMDRVPHIDQSGLYAMEEALLDLRSRNVNVLLTGVHEQPMDMLKSIDIIPDLISMDMIFDSFAESIDWIQTQKNTQSKTAQEAKLLTN